MHMLASGTAEQRRMSAPLFDWGSPFTLKPTALRPHRWAKGNSVDEKKKI
jgi:hypothetical protein